jgi:hypothetical protein
LPIRLTGRTARSPAPPNVNFNANWTTRASRVSVTTAKLLASGLTPVAVVFSVRPTVVNDG